MVADNSNMCCIKCWTSYIKWMCIVWVLRILPISCQMFCGDYIYNENAENFHDLTRFMFYFNWNDKNAFVINMFVAKTILLYMLMFKHFYYTVEFCFWIEIVLKKYLWYKCKRSEKIDICISYNKFTLKMTCIFDSPLKLFHNFRFSYTKSSKHVAFAQVWNFAL